ncbi:hypothetical protein AB0424_25480 [Streptomyces sp. NPDC051180]|uniref:hypothetical protein n=1 Tax=Streptomyces sp. NPDC051180 TaxID=3155797 RepID=UPI00344FCD48
MRFLLWLLLAVGALANVWINVVAGFSGASHVAASVCSGAAVIGAAVGLWLTRTRDAV